MTLYLKFVLLVTNLFISIYIVYAIKVTISNTDIRYDKLGVAMDIHDGNIVQWTNDGDYYFYGMGYQNCTLQHSFFPPKDCPGIYLPFGQCGFRNDHAVRIYKSKDLVSWTLVSMNALTSSFPSGIYYRPKVIRNSLGEYLLWINYLPKAVSPLFAYPSAMYIVASSPSPDGPFVVVTDKASVGNKGGGDFSILVDSWSNPSHLQAFIAYGSWHTNHKIVIEQLNPYFNDHLVLPIHQVSSHHQITKHQFYEGADAEVLVSRHPLGPWTSLNLDLNPKQSNGKRIVEGQNSFIFKVNLSNGNEGFIFVSDRWASAKDRLKSHDLQYWEVLVFDDSVTPPKIQALTGADSFTLDLPL